MNKLAPLYLTAFVLIISACNKMTVSDMPVANIPADTSSATFPGKFLSAEVSLSHKVSDRYEIEGHIKNTSPQTTYTDIILKIDYLDYVGKKIIDTKYYTINKTVKPEKDVSFFIRQKVDDAITGFSVKLFSAITAE